MCAIAALSVASGSARAAFPGANGRIAYGVWTSPTQVKHEIFTIRPNGTGNRLLPLPGEVAHPAWSADGRMLAFERQDGGGIWTARADGSSATEVIRLREPWLRVEHPAWAPDGQRLAFNAFWIEPRPGAGENDISHTAIYVAGSDGIPHRLRKGSQPEWSPDERKIAYVGRGDRSIKIMRADGSNPNTIVRWPGFPQAGFPSDLEFSPDGRRLLFSDAHIVDGGYRTRLRVLDLAVGKVRSLPITDSPIAAAWSPNGRRIAYLWERFGRQGAATQIWTMRPDGSRQRRLYRLRGLRSAESIAWQPRPQLLDRRKRDWRR